MAFSLAIIITLGLTADFLFRRMEATVGEENQHDEPPRLIPTIYLRLWRQDTGSDPGKGKTMSFRYTQGDPSFAFHWEVLYDW